MGLTVHIEGTYQAVKSSIDFFVLVFYLTAIGHEEAFVELDVVCTHYESHRT